MEILKQNQLIFFTLCVSAPWEVSNVQVKSSLSFYCWRIPSTLTVKVETFEVNEVDDFRQYYEDIGSVEMDQNALFPLYGIICIIKM